MTRRLVALLTALALAVTAACAGKEDPTRPPVQAGIVPSRLPARSAPSGVNVVDKDCASSAETAASAGSAGRSPQLRAAIIMYPQTRKRPAPQVEPRSHDTIVLGRAARRCEWEQAC